MCACAAKMKSRTESTASASILPKKRLESFQRPVLRGHLRPVRRRGEQQMDARLDLSSLRAGKLATSSTPEFENGSSLTCADGVPLDPSGTWTSAVARPGVQRSRRQPGRAWHKEKANANKALKSTCTIIKSLHQHGIPG